jgi:hypothetical protein
VISVGLALTLDLLAAEPLAPTFGEAIRIPEQQIGLIK